MAKQRNSTATITPKSVRMRLRTGAPTIRIERSSGNVFEDLGLPDAIELDTKVRLAVAINNLLAARRLTQARAATVLSVKQPKVSALKNFKLEGFSVERLMAFLTALGSDVEIRIRPPKRTPTAGRIYVEAA
jgi:predicted XRE-type DNA-binding protein